MHTELESAAASAPTEDRHSRKCTICNHPDREDIDAAFLHWSPTEHIVRDFDLPSLSALYRHAHARGLWNLRRSHIRHALDRIIELYTATNKLDEVKKWQAERAKYPKDAPMPGEKK